MGVRNCGKCYFVTFVGMIRAELFKHMEDIGDPAEDFTKILSNLHYTHYFLMDKYKRSLESYDLTFTQSNVLGLIVHHYPKSLSLEEISRMVLEPNSDVSRTVVRLTEKGFIQKIKDESNRRKLSIIALPKGLKTFGEIKADKYLKDFTQGITLAQAKVFIEVLKTLRDKEG